MTTRCLCVPLRKHSPTAIATLSAVSGVIGSTLAGPRTPSVPKSLRVTRDPPTAREEYTDKAFNGSYRAPLLPLLLQQISNGPLASAAGLRLGLGTNPARASR